MTIDGAISDLNNLLKADDIPIYYKPSIKKIIETIEQEPCKDAVSREDVENLICSYCDNDNCFKDCARISELKSLPSVQPTSTPCEYAEDCKKMKFEPCEDVVSRADTLQSFESYCENNCQYSKKQRDVMCGACMMGDAIEIVENLPSVTPKPLASVLDEIRAEFKSKADGDDWYHTSDGLVWEEAIEIIDKHRKGESE